MPSYSHSRPAPRPAPGPPPRIAQDVTWTRIIEPRERYRVLYEDGQGERSTREIELSKLGHIDGTPYLGVTHLGK